MEILIPPLRERREDIRPLAQHFLEKHARKAGKTIAGFSPEALAMLAPTASRGTCASWRTSSSGR